MGLNSGALQSSSSNGLSGSSSSANTASSSINASNLNLINSNYLTTQQHTQQCNVLYVAYCLSDDQRFLLTSCSDENGELIESTSISIEIDERFKRNKAHGRRIALRKLWEFVMAIISQTCKPWRLVIGRLGRMGHSELRGWACLLSKKNLQRVCQQFKDSCDTCNILGNMEVPCILSASLISMEGSESICVYPEAFSREDKQAAAA
jgi:mediator of RNA polymerase II transcription subunit 13